MRDEAPHPKVVVPGQAGTAIAQALAQLTMHAGEMSITIKKVRVNGGGYAYQIAQDKQPPLRKQ